MNPAEAKVRALEAFAAVHATGDTAAIETARRVLLEVAPAPAQAPTPAKKPIGFVKGER